MTWKVERLDAWNFKLICPRFDKREFKYESKALEYNVYKRRYTYTPVEDYLFKEEREDSFIFGIGFAPYILYNYYDRLDSESVKILNEFDPIQVNLPELYEYQLDDINKLLQFKRGLFQVYTGYGKTEIIASLINYFKSNTEYNVLVITPNSNALNTIKDRLYKRFGIQVSYWDYESKLNVINVSGFPRSSLFNENHEYWSKVDIIIADEVEYAMNDMGIHLCNLSKNTKRAYGFSATADKVTAEKIRLNDGNIDVVQRNKWIINYFGFASVYKQPSDFVIHEVNINSTLFQDINPNLDTSSELSEIVYQLFTDKRFMGGLKKIILKERGIFIPMFRLQVIDEWIEHIFNEPEMVCVVICSRGTELYEGGKFIKCIDMDTLNDLIDNDIVDLITGTKSCFSAIDMPNLKNVMLLHSSLAGIVIQALGRVSRTKEFHMFNLIPYKSVKMYSSDLSKRDKLIHSYFSQCKFIQSTKLETEYGIY